jgi:hypothetical protein
MLWRDGVSVAVRHHSVSYPKWCGSPCGGSWTRVRGTPVLSRCRGATEAPPLHQSVCFGKLGASMSLRAPLHV